MKMSPTHPTLGGLVAAITNSRNKVGIAFGDNCEDFNPFGPNNDD